MSAAISEVPAFRMSLKMKVILTAIIALSLLCLRLLYLESPGLAWMHILIGTVLFLGLGLGGLFFTTIQFLTSAKWSVVVRRVMESMALTLIVAAALVAVLYYGIHHLYIWSHPAENALLHDKAAFLSPKNFGIRLIAYFVIWFLGAWALLKNSFKQDKTGDASLSRLNFKLSGIFMVFFAVSVSMAGFDLLMSLEPHWFSTIFGVYFFAGFFQATLGVILILAWCLHRSGVLKPFVTVDHFHDIARFLFAFGVFWAYIAFSQFMLIWYGNLPEEIFFYKERMAHGWQWVSLALLLVRFFIPFLVLMPYGAKRCFKVTIAMSLLAIVGQWLDLYWIAVPALRHFGVEGAIISPTFGWKEIMVGIGYISFFFLVVGWIMERVRMVPMKDPRLESSIHYYHH